MSKDANSFGHDKALAWESRGFVYTKKRMHRFDTPSSIELFCLLVNFFFALISSFSLAYNDCLFMFPNVFAYKNNKICKFKTLWNRGTHSK